MSREAQHGESLNPATRRKPSQGGAWCWQQKSARRLIRDRMDGDSKTVYVLSVYDALTEIASDESSESFKTSHPYLAAKAGCGVSQLKVVLAELMDAGLVRIDTPKIKGPCTFTLLNLIEQEADGRNATNDSRNMANVSHKPKLSAVATVEESQEEEIEEKQKNEPSEIIEAWNKTELTKCQKLTDNRRCLLSERLKSDYWRENWRQGLAIIAASSFCLGQNDRGWIADLDWFTKSDDALTKALEGKYSRRRRGSARSEISDDSVWHGELFTLCRSFKDGEEVGDDYIEKKFRKAKEYATDEQIFAYIREQLDADPAQTLIDFLKQSPFAGTI